MRCQKSIAAQLPEYISGVDNESEVYENILESETNSLSIQCALIAVDEILLANPTWFIDQMESTHKYWEEVKKILIDINNKKDENKRNNN